MKQDYKLRRSRPSLSLLLLLVILPAQAGPQALAADAAPRVMNGIDVLRQQDFAPLAGKKVGLITNHTGLAADGTATIDLLHKSAVCKLVAIFSPEHGIRGTMDGGVDSSTDEATGLPIRSLFGETTRPTAEMLRDIDVLVYDIQDVGARFYTYSTTLGYCMEAAAKAKIPIYVLDRPNPISGIRVEGPTLDQDKISFIGYMPLPVRHGMTLGELAKYFNAENQIGADLRVVEMTGWRREYLFSETGQLWVNPSPNMRSLIEAVLYPGVCLLEATNFSVGRGTDRPFEVIGAPWIEPRRLSAALEAARVPGVKFVPVFFTPTTSTHQGVKCGGVQIFVTALDRLHSVLAGLTLVSVLRKLYPNEFEIDKVLRLMGNERALKDLKAGRTPSEVLRTGGRELKAFMQRRRKALIYR